FKRKHLLNKIEGVSVFKSFLNNFIRLSDFSVKKFKSVMVKKRIKMERKKIPLSFKHFYSFIFFFYLNKFNIMIDSFINNNINLFYLVRLYKQKKKKKLYYKNKFLKKKKKKKKIKKKKRQLYYKKKFLEKTKGINSFDYKYVYSFRYKSKKLYK